MRSSSIDTISVTNIVEKNGKLFVKSNSFKILIPVFILFKAFGVEQEQEIFSLITNDPRLLHYLSLSLEVIL